MTAPGTINPVAFGLAHTPTPGTNHTYIAVSAEDIAMDPPPLYVYPARSVSQTGQLTLLKAQLRVQFPAPPGKTNGAKVEGQGFVTNWSWGAALEEKLTASCTVKFSGAITWTDAS